MSGTFEPNADTELVRRLKSGDKSAADELFGRYFDRVTRAAHRRIADRRLRGADSEDIAASVFESLWKKADQKDFDEDDLTSSEEFWRLLCTMIRFKTEDNLRRENAKKRGGGMQRGESAFARSGKDSVGGLSGFSGEELSPYEAAAFRDEHEKMMGILAEQKLQEIVTMRLEGSNVAEIAKYFGKSERWVKRKLSLIRDIWRRELELNRETVGDDPMAG